jgi:hypothetical protein
MHEHTVLMYDAAWFRSFDSDAEAAVGALSASLRLTLWVAHSVVMTDVEVYVVDVKTLVCVLVVRTVLVIWIVATELTVVVVVIGGTG